MKKVLIVDDSALMRRVLSDIINDEEQLIVEKTANNGLEALNVLQGGCRPDILLVDINMPKMDGVQLLKELNKYRIQIPVLIVSSARALMKPLKHWHLVRLILLKNQMVPLAGGIRNSEKRYY